VEGSAGWKGSETEVHGWAWDSPRERLKITENEHEDYRRGVRKYRGKSTRKEHHETVNPDTSREC
jgi:hypothetical protein